MHLTAAQRGHVAMLTFSALVAGSFSLGAMAAPYVAPEALTVLRFALAGAFAASMGLGLLQALAIAAPWSVWGWPLSQLAPILPFALMVLVLVWRPHGLMGSRHD